MTASLEANPDGDAALCTATSAASSAHVQELARRVAAAGCEVTVLTTDVSGSLPREERLEGVSVTRVQRGRGIATTTSRRSIARVVAAGDWDVLHVQSYHTFVAPLAMLAAVRTRLPFVVTFHGGGHSSKLRSALRGAQLAALRPLLNRAERFVAIARFEIDLFGGKMGVPAERFVFIPNGSDLRRQPLTGPLHTTVATLIASVGRLERYKGHHRILAALPLHRGAPPRCSPLDRRLRLLRAGATGPRGSLRRRRPRHHRARCLPTMPTR